MTEHTVRAFTEELEALGADLTRMGGFSEQALGDAVTAIARRDANLARIVIEGDKKIDVLQREIERKIMRLLALRQPMGRDLRQTVAALKLAGELERIGDLAKNIAKRALNIQEFEPIALTRSVERMGKIAVKQLKQILDTLTSQIVAGAVSVWMQDEELDEHYNSLFRELLTYMMEDPRMIGPGAHLLFVAKNIERIGDHCTNMAEVIYYLETGEDIGTDRPKAVDAALPPISLPPPATA
ncbi:phosphate signaling complex protein PhoU [Candidatus Phycosocius spiralis]|uniref:Phosphate-specific transport system accessory protein PhoU n=1 Tax=Candidatus Phycosocius spiralis TaxID=2815099 RepID=A0ABQ4PWD7_9PROT|nr:phosphate signaling complex protein PhoU [Candidatus Phycosocius spiralis]GIU66969.1 phosphate transport system regulatory protein PhoU [Candidatus Phycosocius spiralis]